MPRTGTAARSPSWSSRTGRAARSTRCTAPSTAWWTRSSPAPTPTWGRAARTGEPPRLDRELRHQLPHRRGGAIERRLPLGGELEIEDPRHPQDPLARKAADLERGVRHGVERVAHDDQDGARRVSDDLLRDALDDLEVLLQEVVAAHPRFARQAGGDHDHVRIARLL